MAVLLIEKLIQPVKSSFIEMPFRWIFAHQNLKSR